MADQAVALASRPGPLFLDGLTTLSEDVARVLAEYRGVLFLGELATLSIDTVGALEGHQAGFVLSGVTTLSDEDAAALARYEGPLVLDKLKTLSDTAADALGKHHGMLSLTGLTDLSDRAAAALHVDRSSLQPAVSGRSLSVENAIHGLFPLGRPQATPRVAWVGDRRILRRQTCSTVCLPTSRVTVSRRGPADPHPSARHGRMAERSMIGRGDFPPRRRRRAPLRRSSATCGSAIGRRNLAGTVMIESTRVERDDIETLVASLRPCRCGFELIRLGPDTDGGYLVPDDLEGIAAVLSPGVGQSCGFELACIDRGMRAFLADGSIDESPCRHPALSFRKTFIGVATTDDTLSLSDWIESSGVPAAVDLLLQMDIEGAEFDVLRTLPAADLRRFRILVVEFHRLQRLWDPPFFTTTATMFSRLLETHACVHIHPNNCCGVSTAHGIEIPRTMEFTFLRRDRVTAGGPVPRFPHPLDRDNVPKPTVLLPGCWRSSE